MATMNETYGDKTGIDHIACERCGCCVTCGDCRCEDADREVKIKAVCERLRGEHGMCICDYCEMAKEIMGVVK